MGDRPPAYRSKRMKSRGIIKKILLILILSVSALGTIFAFDYKKIKKNYDEAESYFDKKNYEDAIKKYTEVFKHSAYFYDLKDEEKKQISSDYGLQVDEIGEIKLLYYSLYNIACCYSLTGNFSKAKEYLLYAIYAGYPNPNYIFNDSDMKPLFSSVPSLKSEVEKIYRQGNSKSLVQGKLFEQWIVNDCFRYGFDGDTVIQYYGSSDWKDHKFKGTYKVKNYHIMMHFYKESYRKPDPWASAMPGGGTITPYTSYSEYPEYEDIDSNETINWFESNCYWTALGKDYGSSFEQIEENYTSDWDEKDYTELIAERIEDYYSENRKIERTEEEIKASANRRRQKVLDYIAKVGKNDRTVFILPEGTEKVEWDDIDIPDETVAILLPEGLETFCADIPNDVQYMNFPSTLKGLYVTFSPDSPIEVLDLKNWATYYSGILPIKSGIRMFPAGRKLPPNGIKAGICFVMHISESI